MSRLWIDDGTGEYEQHRTARQKAADIIFGLLLGGLFGYAFVAILMALAAR